MSAQAESHQVFLSGATGVLGSQIAFELLARTQSKLWLLIRADSHATLRSRGAELVSYLTELGAERVSARIEFLRGDAEQIRFGISDGDYVRLNRSLTHIVHAAGDVHFDRSLDAARSTAIRGLDNAIALARAGERPRKLDYVSTVGVAGRREGWILEEAQPTAGIMYRNAYEQAKAEAEQQLLAEIERGLLATIHRPTMIVGDSVTGRIKHPQAFYFLVDYFTGRKGDGVVPACPSIPMDTIPVDYVARAIVSSLWRPELAGEIFHLGSGAEALRLGEILAGARSILARRDVVLPDVTELDFAAYEAYVRARCSEGSRFHRALMQFLPYFRDHIEFDNRRARACFAAEGIHVPSVSSYLERVLNRHWSFDSLNPM